MSDEFSKIIKVVQTTGKAPDTTVQSSTTAIPTAKLVTESLEPTAKTYRFTANEAEDTTNNK